jgi:hypothetical protein
MKYIIRKSLPDLGDGHGLIHVGVECVALLAREDIEYLDGAVSLPCYQID